MQQKDYDDFAGGLHLGRSPTTFEDGQWSRLDGFVFEGPSRLRSQWPIVHVETEFSSSVDDPFEVEATGSTTWLWDAGTGDVRYSTLTVSGGTVSIASLTGSQTWADPDVWQYESPASSLGSGLTLTPDPQASGALRIAGQVAVDSGDTDYEQGVVLTDTLPTDTGTVYHYLLPGDTAGDAYRMEAGLPEDAVTDKGLFPQGMVVGSWADFTIWGDIRWYVDAENPDPLDLQRHRNGLWFSQPGQWDAYDDLDVIFLPAQGTGQVTVLDMVELQQGLVVFCDRATYFLRGTADNFEIEVLATSGNLATFRGAALFDPLGVAVWPDTQGRVWMSDGQGVRRLDQGLGLDPTGDTLLENPEVATLGEYILFSRDRGTELLLFQLTGPDGGTWTRLKIPAFSGLGALNSSGFRLRSLRRNSPGGSIMGVWRDSEVPGVVADTTSLALWIDVEGRLSSTRGYGYESDGAGGTDTVPVTLTLGSPVLSGDGHSRTWWRRVGLRVGEVQDLEAAVSEVRQWTTGGDADGAMDGTFKDTQTTGELVFPTKTAGADDWGVLAARRHFVVPSVGPTRHLRVEWDFTGDLVLEGMSVWGDGVAPDRGRRESAAGTHGTL